MNSIVISEQFYTGAFLVSEATDFRSRDAGVIENGTAGPLQLNGALVVSQNTAGAATITARSGNQGNGAASAVVVQSGAGFGTYSLVATGATSFSVTDPLGNFLPALIVGTAYTDQIGLTITAGSAAFAAGDEFTVNVTATIGAWSSWTGGTFSRLGILYNRVMVEAMSSRNVSIVTRKAEINLAEIQFDPTVTAAADAASLITSAFAALATQNGVIAR